MNKFTAQKVFTNKWLKRAQKHAFPAWTIFEKDYLQRSTEELEKIYRVKQDLRIAEKFFTPATILL